MTRQGETSQNCTLYIQSGLFCATFKLGAEGWLNGGPKSPNFLDISKSIKNEHFSFFRSNFDKFYAMVKEPFLCLLSIALFFDHENDALYDIEKMGYLSRKLICSEFFFFFHDFFV